jgi:hypothetical protein
MHKRVGDKMGICIGDADYCDRAISKKGFHDVLFGPNGEPHVAIESRPTDPMDLFRKLSKKDKSRVVAETEKALGYTYEEALNSTDPIISRISNYLDHIEKTYVNLFGPPPPEIYQVRGKGNARDVDPRYLEDTRDFLNSRNWLPSSSKARDFTSRGTLGGLVDTQYAESLAQYAKRAKIGIGELHTKIMAAELLGRTLPGRFATDKDIAEFIKLTPAKAEGGAVRMKDGGQVQRFDEGGEVNQSELDRMKFEIAQAQYPNSPVMQATPRSPIQDFIGTAGGYMDKAGRFITQAIEPIAEKNPVKTFLADMLLAAPLRGAGTALQDYTGTVRETDEDNPVRGVVSKDWSNLTTSREPMLDPRVLDIAQFATPVVGAGLKAARVGAKAITPFAKSTAEMAAELYGRGQMPGMVAPNAYMAEPSAPKPAKALAPANEQGFYSPTEAAALNLQRKSGSGQALLNDIMKGENVRSEEVSGMGLDTFLKDKKNVTAAEVQDYIAQNKLGLGEAIKKDLPPIEDWAKENFPDDYKNWKQALKDGDTESSNFWGDAINDAYKLEIDKGNKSTKFGQYQLPGGKNYREVVLTLPDPKDALMDQIKALGITKEKNNISINDILQRGGSDELAESWKEAIYKQYTTGHWNEINPIAHLRVSDRVTDGKKTLLVDEVQSDWHQAARDLRTAEVKRLVENGMPKDQAQKAVPKDYGYANPKERQKIVDKLAREEPLTADEEVARRRYLASKNVPDAPYKDDYYQLALRRAIKEAIDGGYDRIALPTGARVAERFSLVNHVDSIDYKLNENGKYRLGVTDKDGFGIDLPQKEYTKEELPGLLGKDVANQLINKEGQWGGGRYTLRGVDLKIGGEGMKKYYDEVYPGYLKNFGKKYGATVGNTTVDAGGAAEPLRYMDITPAMRKEFGTGIHMKRGGQVKQPFTPPQYLNYNIDHMRHELMRQG